MADKRIRDRREYQAQFYLEHRERILRRVQEYYAKNKERCRATGRRYYQKHKDERRLYAQNHREQHRLVSKRWAQENRMERKAWTLKYREGIKIATLAHYSNSDIPCCILCGITDIDVLCLDHINNDALIRGHRGGGKGGANFYFELQKADYPQGYKTLCANCNLKKELKRRRNCALS